MTEPAKDEAALLARITGALWNYQGAHHADIALAAIRAAGWDVTRCFRWPVTELDTARAENARLRAALNTLLEITDKCKTMQIGAGGMSIEAQAYRTVYLRVPIWPFEEARAALAGEVKP